MAKKNEWFPVDVMLPDNARPVLAFGTYGFCIGMYHPLHRCWYLTSTDTIDGITSWQELPEEP